jgi:hypothetical protein
MQAQCNTGYTGNLCAVCAKDPRLGNGTAYGFSTVFKCTPCRSTAALICLSVLGFFLQFAIITYCVWSNVQINRERYSSGEALSSDFIKVGIQRVQKHHLGPGGGCSELHHVQQRLDRCDATKDAFVSFFVCFLVSCSMLWLS